MDESHCAYCVTRIQMESSPGDAARRRRDGALVECTIAIRTLFDTLHVNGADYLHKAAKITLTAFL